MSDKDVELAGMRVVSRREVLDAFYELQDALIRETETKQLLRFLSEETEQKKRRFFKLIDDADDVPNFIAKTTVVEKEG